MIAQVVGDAIEVTRLEAQRRPRSSIFHEFDRDHQPEAADLSDDRAGRQGPTESLAEPRPLGAGAVRQSLLVYDPEACESGGARRGMAAVGKPMRNQPAIQTFGDVAPHRHGSERLITA